MIGEAILYYKIVEKLGEPSCAPECRASAGRVGLARPSCLGCQAETGRNRQNNNLGKI